jgi:hypothetical protein
MLAAIMRTLAILLVALAIALSPPAALAKSDKTPPGQAMGNQEPPGQAQRGDKPAPPGQSGDGPHGPDGAGPPGQDGGHAGQGALSDQNEAQRAVESKQALPLARIVSIAQSRTPGHVINARLVRIEGVLLYQLTLLDETGRSWRDYYYARTGNPVIIP